MMGVALASASLGFLTLIWSFVCLMFQNIGNYPRSIELLITLSFLTGIQLFFKFIKKDRTYRKFVFI